jgi:hypothetical protein
MKWLRRAAELFPFTPAGLGLLAIGALAFYSSD